MPGWEVDPNINAAEILAYDYLFTGESLQTIGQFPTGDDDVKVVGFWDDLTNTNLSIKFDNTQFPE